MSAILSTPALHDYSTTRGKKGREWKGDGGKGLEHDSRNWLKVFQAGKDKKGWTCMRKKCVHKDNPDDIRFSSLSE